jgi:hypothetical protein
MKSNSGKKTRYVKLFALIVLFIFSALSFCHAQSADTMKKQYVVFKFDDLTNSTWKTWKTVTDIVISKDVKADLGIFVQSLLSGDEEYMKYIKSILDDPKHFEIWLHGYTGDAKEFFESDYSTQLDHFHKARTVMLNKFDYIIRDFQDHYYGGNQNTVRIINEEPFIKGWVYYQNSVFKYVYGVKPDKQVMPILNVYMEPKVGTVSYDKYKADWIKFKADTLPYVVIQGHAWGYRTDSLRNEFSKVVDDLKAKGVTFTHFNDYRKMIKGYSTDKTPPTVPSSLRATRIDDTQVKLNWNASKDSESRVDCYKIYRDEICIDLSATTSFIDKETGAHKYEVCAVNNNDLVSAKSVSASVK